jgi:ubiquinone/menaquinone biosynthesis C-methylase UbiE
MTDNIPDGGDLGAQVQAAYDATGAAWDRGPRRIYDLLAGDLLDRSPLPFDHAVAVDAGAGTGAATTQLIRRGARVTAVDLSVGMLRCLAVPDDARPQLTIAVGDVVRLPVRTGAVDIAVAAFVLNHLPRPLDGLRELTRVTRPDGAVLASVFGAAPPHPSKDAIDAVAARHGFTVPDWYRRMKTSFEAQVATQEALARLGRDAGLVEIEVEAVHLDPRMTEADLVSWRAGMAHLAPFIASLRPDQAEALRAEARAAVVGMPPLTIAMVTLVGRQPA